VRASLSSDVRLPTALSILATYTDARASRSMSRYCSTGPAAARASARGTTLTHAGSGISVDRDLALDARLPFDEPYHTCRRQRCGRSNGPAPGGARLNRAGHDGRARALEARLCRNPVRCAPATLSPTSALAVERWLRTSTRSLHRTTRAAPATTNCCARSRADLGAGACRCALASHFYRTQSSATRS